MDQFFKYIGNKYLKLCPKSGRIVGLKSNKYSRILFPVIGIAAIVWFLVRVIPKPTRAEYPCQKVAATIGGSFLLYIFGAISSMVIYDQIRNKINKKLALTWIGGIALFASVGIGIAQNEKSVFVPNLTNPDGINNPIGDAKGIFPGRVAWTQDFDATNWDEKTGMWWDDKATSQAECDKMMSKTLQNLTGAKTDKEAWQKLFEFNNKMNGQGKKGYVKGEIIVVKINMNAIHNVTDPWKNQGYPSPHMLNSLVRQLIEVAGVSGDDIIITDPSRYIGEQINDKIRNNRSSEYLKITIEEREARKLAGYRTAQPDTTAAVWFNMPNDTLYKMYLPKSYTEATYIINYGLVRPHRVFGITLSAKNHFGAVWDIEKKAFAPHPLHAFALWDYATPNKLNDPHSAPVLLGHKIINNKTFLYLADGLFTSINQNLEVARWSTFSNDWFSSLLMSQDPVALESVVYDFIASEPNLVTGNPSFNGNQDNQFLECAMANNPPSGTKYDPENDGTRLESLGVHEHWNNASDREYSRNLGKKKGIELISAHL
ncbi:MAG: DUF362 domain-containing protein [Bacteroidales bacterium]|nr:DUF362 domain-containing protein [Bacteroidales bacterium]